MLSRKQRQIKNTLSHFCVNYKRVLFAHTVSNILSLSAAASARICSECRWLMGNVLCMTCAGALFLRLLLPRNFRERDARASKSFFMPREKSTPEQNGDGAIKKMLTCSPWICATAYKSVIIKNTTGMRQIKFADSETLFSV